MKRYTLGVFATRADAEDAINDIHNKAGVSTDEISYVYRNNEGQVKQVEADDIADRTPAEGASTGAKAGAVIGGIAGIAAAIGAIPVVGPLVAGGAFMTWLGIGGATGATVGGALAGAAIGGLVGALVNIGVSDEEARHYEDQVASGNILVTVHSEKDNEVEAIMMKHGATDIDTYAVSV